MVITASHNPAGYNGIKLFDSMGAKLSDEEEVEIENLLDGIDEVDTSGAFEWETAVDCAAVYRELLQSVLPPDSLKDWRIVGGYGQWSHLSDHPEDLAAFWRGVDLYGGWAKWQKHQPWRRQRISR